MPEIPERGRRKPWTKSRKRPRSFKPNGQPNFAAFVPFYGSTAQHDKRYQSARWKRVRLLVLNDAPTCPTCMNRGRVVSAAHVDHVRRHDTGGLDFYDERNLWGLCEGCHAVKSGLESAGVYCPQNFNFGEAKQWWMVAICDAIKRNK
jgi:5-methylcytosine-specific restriction endonuclease McrA